MKSQPEHYLNSTMFSYVDLFDCFFSKPMLRKEEVLVPKGPEWREKRPLPLEQPAPGLRCAQAVGLALGEAEIELHKQINGQTSVIVFFIPEVGESSEGLEAGTLMNMPHHKYGCVTEQATYDMELLAALRLLSSQEAGSPEYPVCHHPNNVSE
ncbi:hypothetical protein MG293_012182 [Ovis ammon polii]|uniref:Uncharacterized protein n=1 Tax=Ovis ammon polii TaxID=230172 RepID=A0AAD4U3V5_OVIAM|nr:hypothetical protein MG293_012182 [Ovis ammon polii]